MGITALVVADSVSMAGKRITTLELRYPRFIHAEFMTHRVFSRNASSSRAIPVKRMLGYVIRDPAMPVHWGANQKGMQAVGELQGLKRWLARQLWLLARWPAVAMVWLLTTLGLHKQVANRILEPWLHITVCVTATEFGNFFNLRIHKAAQPEMQALATAMFEAMEASKPVLRKPNEGVWSYHLPYVSDAERLRASRNNSTQSDACWELMKISGAHCARTSYLTMENKMPTAREDLDLYSKLVGQNPKHASPTEHQACPVETEFDEHLCGNFRGWVQARKLILDENMPEYKGGGRP